ncbi:DEP domain-containing protein 1B-like [Styela clava]
MVYQGMTSEDTPNTSIMSNSKKLTPGPYRATKLWNGIVKKFREEMQCKKHRRHLKTYNACFSASEATDFLHDLLKKNCNIGNDVARHQTVQLLRKFLKNHVIEDVQGRWGNENFEDDGRLFRFPLDVSLEQTLRHPLGTLDDNVPKHTRKANTSKKMKRKSKISVGFENNNVIETEKKQEETEKVTAIKSSSTSSTSSNDHLKRPLPPVPVIPKCRVLSQTITEADVQDAWKKELLCRLQGALKLDTLDEILNENEISGEDIRHNSTKIGKSGVVQVEKGEDIPYWALSAMTCLANWPNGKDTGLPCYPGFEKDVFKAVCDYYCGMQSANTLENFGTTKRRQAMSSQPVLQPEPLLTYEHYELFTNIVCLIQPDMEKVAIESLRLALLILPPSNRRKLHLLLRLMSKMCSNPHLVKLGGHTSTRSLLLQKFSRHILSCNEEVYLDELLAMRLVSFMVDHHTEVMKVPTDIEKAVGDKIAKMRRPDIRYNDSGEEVTPTHYVLSSNSEAKARWRYRAQQVQGERHHFRRKSTDIMKSWDKLVSSIKNKHSTHASSSATDSSDSESYVKMSKLHTKRNNRFSHLPQESATRFRQRTNTVGTRFLEPSSSPADVSQGHRSPLNVDFNESRIKPAKSCSDIFDLKTSSSSSSTKLQKASDLGSSWNLRLRPMLGKPFSKFRRSKV